jgi:hypothetical protein
MHDNIDRDEHTGVATTGHEWDGIKELDQPLPRWWLYIFYASIVIAAVMWVLYPAWPGVTSYTHGLLNQSDRADVASELRDLKRSRHDLDERLLKMSFDAIEADPEMNAYALAAGEAAFGDNCATAAPRAILPSRTMSGCGAARWPTLSIRSKPASAATTPPRAFRRCRRSANPACSSGHKSKTSRNTSLRCLAKARRVRQRRVARCFTKPTALCATVPIATACARKARRPSATRSGSTAALDRTSTTRSGLAMAA